MKSAGMDCFEWNSHASDYIDGDLSPSRKKSAEAHLASCEECSERLGHFREILGAISSQPKSALPIPIRKAPLAPTIPRIDIGVRRFSRSRWHRVPWPLRTAIEGMTIVLLVLVGISVGPAVRRVYEQRMENNIDRFSDILPDSENQQQGPPLAHGKESAPGDAAAAAASEGAGASADEEDDSGGDEDTAPGVRFTNSEMWRFTLKTDSPAELRGHVIESLAALKVPPATPGYGGTDVPGGIEFDMILNRSLMPELKHLLQKAAPPPPPDKAGTPEGETFTWFHVKSKRRVPEGKARVVIWLSQF